MKKIFEMNGKTDKETSQEIKISPEKSFEYKVMVNHGKGQSYVTHNDDVSHLDNCGLSNWSEYRWNLSWDEANKIADEFESSV